MTRFRIIILHIHFSDKHYKKILDILLHDRNGKVCSEKIRSHFFLVNFVIEVHNNSFDLLGRETVKNYSVILVHKGLPTPLHRLPPKKNSEKI